MPGVRIVTAKVPRQRSNCRTFDGPASGRRGGAQEFVRGVLVLEGGVEVGLGARREVLPDPDVRGGDYFGPGVMFETRGYPKLVSSNEASHDAAAQRRLWEISEKLTGVTYPI